MNKQLVILFTSCKYWTYEEPENNCYLVRSNKALEYSSDKTSGIRGCSKNSRNIINVDRCPEIDGLKSVQPEPTDYTHTDYTPVTMTTGYNDYLTSDSFSPVIYH